MKEEEALDFANEQLLTHGLAEKGWTVEIRPGRLGGNGGCAGLAARFAEGGGIILLRLRDVLMLSDSKVREIILHEIAHALAPPNVGHGSEWRAIARQLGTPDNAHSADPSTVELNRLLRRTRRFMGVLKK
jgi:SprT-like family